MTVTFTSRLSAAGAPLKRAWEHTVGGPATAMIAWIDELPDY